VSTDPAAARGVTVPASTRPRSSRLPRSARRTQLLQAAREVFVAQGYHASAMDDIAERAGVSKPVLYQHFPGKYDLYLALVDQNAAEIIAAVRQALASTDDHKQQVEAAMTAFFEFIDREGESFRLIFESDLTNDGAVQDRVTAVSLEVARAIADVIRSAAEVTDQDAEMLGIALGGMANVTARHWLRTGRTMPRDQAVRLLSRLCWRGIRGVPLAGAAATAAAEAGQASDGAAGKRVDRSGGQRVDSAGETRTNTARDTAG
jgi:AcrR family transcriptional regulator